MPPESPAEIQTQWQNEFPGITYTIKTLRDRLIQAHLYLHRTEFELDQLHLELEATGLPCRHWDARTHRQIKFLHHLKSQADRDFHRALMTRFPTLRTVVFVLAPRCTIPQSETAAPPVRLVRLRTMQQQIAVDRNLSRLELNVDIATVIRVLLRIMRFTVLSAFAVTPLLATETSR